MQLSVTSLNSGSNGNCYYIGNENDGIIIDAGLSCKETENRMRLLGLSMTRIRGIFISHEHSDHINGLQVISSKYQIPIYATAKTREGIKKISNDHLFRNLISESPVNIGSLFITSFSKNHDASDPQSFIISNGKTTVGVFTDIGMVCENVISFFSRCHGIFLEANYDEDMLENGKYPKYLKDRIRSDKGHLSNLQALELFKKHKPEFMSHVFLSHLSKENNDPQIAKELFDNYARDANIIIASRHEQTAIYKIGTNPNEPTISSRRSAQMNLFE